MKIPKVTVSLLTYNRPDTLRLTLDSVLAQDYDDFVVTVMDNGSTDDTPHLIQSYMQQDQRVGMSRIEKNIGIVRNWNRGLFEPESPYICIFHDDDIMHRSFLRETAAALDAHPSAGFALVRCEFINDKGEVTGVSDLGDAREGFMSGLDVLELAVDNRNMSMYPTGLLLRRSAVHEAGPLESFHMRGYFDIDFFYRICARRDIVFIPRPLIQYRQHEASDTELLNREVGGTPWYGDMATKIDQIAPLLRSPRAADEKYRNWLADRLLYLHAHQSNAIHPSLPGMYHPWETRLALAKEQLESVVAPGQSVILIDDGQLGLEADLHGRRIIPFLERDGHYWGPPDHSEQALADFKRLHESGAQWLAFAWGSFWWMDRYREFHRHVAQNYPCRLNTPHLVGYDLRS